MAGWAIPQRPYVEAYQVIEGNQGLKAGGDFREGYALRDRGDLPPALP